jgi:uncharacterized coiled-coil protein SlyX
MMTTFSAMRRWILKTAIIGALLALLSGCSALRLTYANGPQLTWWWIDGYLDFGGEQVPRVKAAIDRWFEWHRTTQLADVAALLGGVAAQMPEPATPGQICRLQQQAVERFAPAIERALLESAEIAPTLGEAQWRHLEQRFAKNRADMRSDYLQSDPDDRRKASVKRVVERFESIYGSVGDAQRRVIASGVAASPFDPELWIAERERRQRDTVQTLRRLVAERADRDQVVAALRVLVERVEFSPDAAYRSYQQRLTEYNCAFAAQIHNATTPAQRQAARERLKGWEEDLRSLVAGGG